MNGFGGIGGWELLLVAVIAMIVLGPDDVLDDPRQESAELPSIVQAEPRSVTQDLQNGVLDEVGRLDLGAQNLSHALAHALLDPVEVAIDQRFEGLPVAVVPVGEEIAGVGSIRHSP